ncbi:MAG: 5-formyltetrahydrofolate cyclo-ligase, partial [Oscillospiraceae bacterium]|nr:5-formyltetrahydrofolate cyclo-ligase [Oscillospiraceae bacterium]
SGLICSLGLNTLWLYILYRGAVVAMIPGRALNALVMIFVQALCFVFCGRVFKTQTDRLLMERKSALRREARSYCLKNKDKLPELSVSVEEGLLSLPEYAEAQTVFCYCSTELEIDTDGIINNALESGKLVCVPLCGENRTMTARLIRSLEDVKEGRFGLREPSADAPLVNRESIDLAVVPALMCSRGFERLGNAGGYYDRYFENSDILRAALCREALLKNRLPSAAHDVKMDIVVTESAVLRREEKERGV